MSTEAPRQYKHLYLPIEEAARELNSRLLLLIAAVSQGYRVVIGQQWLMHYNLFNFVPGVVFFKGSNKIQSHWFRVSQEYGHRVAAIDEEVTAIADRRFVLKEVSPASLPNLDRFFLQGQNQYDIYADAFPEYRDRFEITGNPRFDLLREEFSAAFQDDARRYREQYGPYILINTNFGYVNTAWGEPDNFVSICEQVGYANRKDAEDAKFFRDFLELESKNMEAFKVMVRALRDRFPEHQILLRPHPAENLSTWEDELRGEERVHVVFEGSAVPWLLGADFFIHNTCTTGTEAMVLGIPVAAYASFTNWVESIFLSNLVTPIYRDLGDLLEAVAAGVADRDSVVEKIRSEKGGILRQHIAGLDERYATAGIFRGIQGLAPQPVSGSVFRDAKGLKFGIARTKYQYKKIDLSLEEFNTRLRNLIGAMGISFQAKSEQIGDSLFMVTPRD